MAKGIWTGPGIFQRKSAADIYPGNEIDSNWMDGKRWNKLVEVGAIKANKVSEKKAISVQKDLGSS